MEFLAAYLLANHTSRRRYAPLQKAENGSRKEPICTLEDKRLRFRHAWRSASMPRLRLNDTQIATVVGCSVWTVRKWRRRSIQQGRVGLTSQMGRPATGPVSTFPNELKEAILHLRRLHPGWGPNTLLAARKHGCCLSRSASAESSTHSGTAQTSRSDAPLSTPS